MGQKNRTIIVVLIALVIVAAVFASFGLYLLPGQTPQVVLPTSSGADAPGNSQEPAGSDGGQFLPVEVTPDTVQSIFATLDRADSYAREVTVTDFWGEDESGTTIFSVWVDNGFTRVQSRLNSGRVQNTLLENGTLYLWYDQSQKYLTFDGAENTSDLIQRFPTYEDVLEMDKSSIIGAGYTVQDSWTCVYVEVSEDALGYLYRYWVDIDSGLLIMAETEEDGQVVYRMTSSSLQTPCPATALFRLPDGTQLHQVG